MKLTDYGFQVIFENEKGSHLSNGVPDLNNLQNGYKSSFAYIAYNGNKFVHMTENKDSIRLSFGKCWGKTYKHFSIYRTTFIEKNRMYQNIGRDKIVLNRILSVVKSINSVAENVGSFPKELQEQLEDFIEKFFEFLDEKRLDEEV